MTNPEHEWQVHPVTPDRFEDLVRVLNPTRRDKHCWCLSHRLTAAQVRELGQGSRKQAMRRLCERKNPPGVIAYREGTPVGWCSISPRADNTKLANSKLIRPVDGVDVWSIICLVVRSGFRGQGVTGRLIDGALGYAMSRAAPAVEAYPVDPPGRMDTTMAFVGTRSMFEAAGFEVIGTTGSLASRMPRLIMRKTLPDSGVVVPPRSGIL